MKMFNVHTADLAHLARIDRSLHEEEEEREMFMVHQPREKNTINHRGDTGGMPLDLVELFR